MSDLRIRSVIFCCCGVLIAGCADASAEVTDAEVTDAGATDAGVRDAGVTDAGVRDAGVTDAGSTDAGSTDAGMVDAGMVDDEGEADAGVADAGGAADAGQVADAGADAGTDAGTLDAGPPLSFIAVSAGGYSDSCALTADGLVYCWGQAFLASTNRPVPTPLEAGDGGPHFVALSTGGTSSCALTDAGEAWCWGLGVPGDGGAVLSTARQVSGVFSQVSAAQGLAAYMCGVGDGGVYCWGYLPNERSAVGPVLLSGSSALRNVTCGEAHSCALDDAGAAFCWGDNSHGQLGQGSSSYRSEVPVAVVGGHTFKNISAGVFHSCAITMTGEGYCWGELGPLDGGFGPTRSPLALAGGHAFADISAGWDWTCGLDGDGGALCWGTGGRIWASSLIPAPLGGGVTFSTITTGTNHACGRGLDGLIYCWGNGGAGALGDGRLTDSPVPVLVAGQ